MQQIDVGTSAQGHTGLLINHRSASATAKALHITLGATTGTGIYLSGGTSSGRYMNFDLSAANGS